MKRLYRGISALLAVALMLAILPLHSFAAPDLSDPNQKITVNIPVTFGQTEARSMLEYINNFRLGRVGQPGATTNPPQCRDRDEQWVDCSSLKELKYDYELERIAMQRAAEIAVSFAHRRPNGNGCFSLYPFGAAAENIAAGYATAIDTFVQWREDDDGYDGQGHRRNMLARYQSVGIGHVEYQGQHYWVQAFSSEIVDSTPTQPVDEEREVPVEIQAEQLFYGAGCEPELSLESAPLQLEPGRKAELPRAEFQFVMQESWPQSRWNKRSGWISLDWTSQDPEIASCEGNTVTAKKPGSTQLTGQALGESFPVEITVACNHQAKQEWEHDAAEHWHSCAVCGEKLDAAAHSFRETTVPATCVKDGLKTRLCTVCGYEERQVLPALPHSLIHHPRVEPALNEQGQAVDGMQEHWSCTVCGQLFAEEAAEKPVSREELVIPVVRTRILEQPQSQSVPANTNAQFAVTAEGVGLTYQWQYLNTANGSWDKCFLTGNTTDTLTVKAAAYRDGMQFRCVVTGGGQSVTSDPAVLTLKNDSTPAKITGQPQNQSVPVNTNAQFTVTAEGTGLTYQWQVFDAASNKWIRCGLGGNATNTLTVKAAAYRNGMQFRCVVTGGGQSVTSEPAVLTLKDDSTPAKITGQPQNQSVPVNTNAQFTVTAEGTGLTYQWQVFDEASGKWIRCGLGGNTTRTLTVKAAAYRDGMQFRCVVTGGGRSVTSEPAVLTLKDDSTPAKITGQPQSQSVPVNTNAQFTVTAEGTGLTYQWQVFDAASGKWIRCGLGGNATNTLTVKAVAYRNGMKFRCVVTGGGQSVTSEPAVLTVR